MVINKPRKQKWSKANQVSGRQGDKCGLCPLFELRQVSAVISATGHIASWTSGGKGRLYEWQRQESPVRQATELSANCSRQPTSSSPKRYTNIAEYETKHTEM